MEQRGREANCPAVFDLLLSAAVHVYASSRTLLPGE